MVYLSKNVNLDAASHDEVKAFLTELRIKMAVWAIVFMDDKKTNVQTLLNLEITPSQRLEIVRALTFSHFCSGPIKENLYGLRDMWIFGNEVNKKEVYIKITLGIESGQSICISFHIAEHPLKYAFKK